MIIELEATILCGMTHYKKDAKGQPASELGAVYSFLYDDEDTSKNALCGSIMQAYGSKDFCTAPVKLPYLRNLKRFSRVKILVNAPIGKTEKLDDSIAMQHWKVFRQKLQRYSRDVKIVGVKEKHNTEVGGLHLHLLVGDIDFDNKLIFAYNRDPNSRYYGQKYKTDFGDQVYNFITSFYDYGFTTVVKLRQDSNFFQISNYMSKYMTEDLGKLDYGTRALFRTHNLQSKEKHICYFTPELLEQELAQYDLTTKVELVKDVDKYKCIRIYENNILENIGG